MAPGRLVNTQLAIANVFDFDLVVLGRKYKSLSQTMTMVFAVIALSAALKSC